MPGDVALEDAECGDGALTACGAAAANVGPRLSDTRSHASADRPLVANLASLPRRVETEAISYEF
jgi:hypothetical protein